MINKIKFTEVNPIKVNEIRRIKKDIFNTIKNGDFILGGNVKKFEKNFAKLAKTKFAVGCASGTDALTLSLMSLNLNKNDEVIVPGMTYISTGLSVILNNYKLVLVDVDSQTGLICLESLKKKLTKKTKVVIPVNLYGQRVDLKKLQKVVGKKIHIIEDSAQSHFAFEGNTGKIINNNIAIASCFSFYPAKNLGAFGDGGIITTNNKSVYSKLLALRNLGSVKKNKHVFIGMNSRLDTIQATVLLNKLKTILNLNAKRRKIGMLYDKLLKNIKQIKLTKTNKGSTRHLYVIRTKSRDKLINYLSKKKISCQMHYPYSLSNLPAFNKKLKKTNLKISESWAKECLSLPIHPNLKETEAKRVVYEITKFFKAN